MALTTDEKNYIAGLKVAISSPDVSEGVRETVFNSFNNIVQLTTDTSIVGQDVSDLLRYPSIDEDSYAIVWDNANEEFTLAASSSGDVDTIYTADGIISDSDIQRVFTIENNSDLFITAYDLTSTDYTVNPYLIIGVGSSKFGVNHYDRDADENSGSYELNFGNGEMIVVDTYSGKGLVYDADYSANYTTRSLVDKDYVDSLYTFTRGLTESSGTVRLGGSIDNSSVIITGGDQSLFSVGLLHDGYDEDEGGTIQFTTSDDDTGASLRYRQYGNSIDISGYDDSSVSNEVNNILVEGTGYTYLNSSRGVISRAYSGSAVGSGDITSLSVFGSGITVSSALSTFEGVEYAADYSANFTDRSLVDKAYVDSATPDTIYTADGSFTGSRIVTANTSGLIEIQAYDTTSADFTAFSRLKMDQVESIFAWHEGSGDGTTSGKGQIKIDTDGMEVSDSAHQKGLYYAGDYSATFVNRSLVDKEYVDGLIPDSIYTADGSYTGARTVTADTSGSLTVNTYNLSSSDYDARATLEVESFNSFLAVYDGDGGGGDDGKVEVNLGYSEGIVVTDSLFGHGFKYAQDYSSTFQDRSLVDKAYVDASIPTFQEVIDSGSTATLSTGTFQVYSENGTKYVLQQQSQSSNRIRFSGEDSSTDYAHYLDIEDDGVNMWGYNNDDNSSLAIRIDMDATPLARMYYNDTNYNEKILGIGSAGIVFTDSVDSKGAEYAADYSANYTDRSLVDKAYADSVTGNVSWTTTIPTTLESGNGYFVDSSSSAQTITLPLTPSLGDWVEVCDYTGSSATNNITIEGNGSNIAGASDDYVIDIDRASIRLTYSDATNGWVITIQA